MVESAVEVQGWTSEPWRTQNESDRFWAVGLRTCKVSCSDANGVEHSVEVTARSLFEAVGRELQVFRDHDWIESVPGNRSVTITVKNPEVEHTVRLADFERWLQAQSKSPAEEALKTELRGQVSKDSGKSIAGRRGTGRR